MERRKVLQKTGIHLRKVKLPILIWTYALRVMQMFSNIFTPKLSLFFVIVMNPNVIVPREVEEAGRIGCVENLCSIFALSLSFIGLIRCFSVW